MQVSDGVLLSLRRSRFKRLYERLSELSDRWWIGSIGTVISQHSHEIHHVREAVRHVRKKLLVDLGRWCVGSELRHSKEELSQLAVIEQEQSWLLDNRAIQFAIPGLELLHQRGETVLQRLSSEIRRSAVESLRGALEPRMTGSLECQACLVCLSSDLEACDKVTKLTLLGVLDSLVIDEDCDGAAEILHVGWWQHVSLVVKLIVTISNSLSVAKSKLRPEFVAR